MLVLRSPHWNCMSCLIAFLFLWKVIMIHEDERVIAFQCGRHDASFCEMIHEMLVPVDWDE